MDGDRNVLWPPQLNDDFSGKPAPTPSAFATPFRQNGVSLMQPMHAKRHRSNALFASDKPDCRWLAAGLTVPATVAAPEWRPSAVMSNNRPISVLTHIRLRPLVEPDPSCKRCRNCQGFCILLNNRHFRLRRGNVARSR
jgi:hypothetical protein